MPFPIRGPIFGGWATGGNENAISTRGPTSRLPLREIPSMGHLTEGQTHAWPHMRNPSMGHFSVVCSSAASTVFGAKFKNNLFLVVLFELCFGIVYKYIFVFIFISKLAGNGGSPQIYDLMLLCWKQSGTQTAVQSTQRIPQSSQICVY